MRTHLTDKEFSDEKALWPFLKQLFTYAFRYRQWFVPFIIGTVIVAAVDAIIPLIWLHFIDDVVTPLVNAHREAIAEGVSPALDFSGLKLFGIIYLAMLSIQIVCVGVFVYFAGKIEENVMYSLRKDMFNKLQRLSFSFYDRSSTGWLISRITSDTDRVTELLSWGFLELIWGITMIFACFIAMLLYSWKLTLVVLITVPVLMFISVRLRLLVLKFARKARKINSEMIAYFNEHIHGVEVNKTTAREETASQGYQGLTGNMRMASFKSAYYSAMYSPMVIMVGSIAAALVVYWGGSMAVAGVSGMTVGVLAAFFSYARVIYEPILDIARFYALAQGSLSAGERIFSLINEEIEIADKADALDYQELSGNIEFQDVSFEYVSDQPVLSNLSLQINPGESIALVGPTGEGKTTIASLISRFYEPTSGTLLIDGVDYRERTLHSLRSQLGIILQTPHVFSGTVRENITYGENSASDEDVNRVLRSIGATELIGRLDEAVGEEGGTLSLGEKQLISFARVILRDPKVIIMDEATASVDTLAESKIQQGIRELISGRTSIIIAHRLSTIKECDRILIIKDGRIVESGNHDSLMAERGHYHHLYTRQSRQPVEMMQV